MCACQVKGNGSFLIYASQAPQTVQVDGADTEHAYDAATGGLTVQLAAGDKLTREVVVRF